MYHKACGGCAGNHGASGEACTSLPAPGEGQHAQDQVSTFGAGSGGGRKGTELGGGGEDRAQEGA